MAHTLVLLRHGHSDWNAKNLFTGWVDVDLNDQGREEALRGGQLLKDNGVLPTVVHTSVLRRAITTANLPSTWPTATGSRCAATGGSTSATTARCRASTRRRRARSTATSSSCSGAARSTRRRREIEVGSEFDQSSDPRYAGIEVPRTECLKDVIVRMMPYWEGPIRDDLSAGETVLVVAHGNSLRGLVKHLDGISDEAIAELNIPTGQPLVYELGDDFMPTRPAEYLDPEAAAAAAAAVANQGR